MVPADRQRGVGGGLRCRDGEWYGEGGEGGLVGGGGARARSGGSSGVPAVSEGGRVRYEDLIFDRFFLAYVV